jgi:peptide/nickel transport system substrate-binding protein
MTYRSLFKAALLAPLCALLLTNAVAAETIIRRAHDLSGGGAESLDPISPTPFYYMNELIYDTLVQPELGKDEPVPALAVSWTSSPDSKVWTFHLRSGVKFHDGSAFDANDVVYSFDRIKDPKLESPVTTMLSYVEKVEAVDPLTVRITLASANADFLSALQDDRLSMISEGSGDKIGETGIGTGPFKIVKYDPEGTTKLAAFDEYWDGRPKVDGITFVAIPDTEARVQALLAGQIDMDSVSIEHANQFADTSKFQILPYSNGGWNGIAFRTDTPPFDDARVRKAVRIAVNREEMIQLIAGKDGGQIACDNPVWQGDPYHAEIDCKQDIEGAKKLLAEAGYPDGIDFEIYTSDLEPAMVRYAEVYQQQVAAAGIRVTIKLSPGDGYWTDVWMVKPVTVTSWSGMPADLILNEAYRSTSSWNETYYKNPEMDRTLDAARTETDFEKRKRLYQDAQRLLYEDGGSLIAFYTNVLNVVSTRIKGIPAAHSSLIRWNQDEVVE